MRGGGGWMESIPEETLSRTETERVLRRLAGMLTPYRGRIALIIVVIAAQVGALLAGAALVGYGIDEGLR